MFIMTFDLNECDARIYTFGIKSLETRDPIPRHFTANYQVKKQFQLEEKETSIYHWQNVLFFLIFTSPWAHSWPLAVSQGHGRKSREKDFLEGFGSSRSLFPLFKFSEMETRKNSTTCF